jgi:hypothetical protein
MSAAPRPATLEAPFPLAEGTTPPEGMIITERHLSDAEAAELVRLRRRELRGSILAALLVLWPAGGLMRALLGWRRLVADVRGRRVLVLRPAGSPEAPPVVEALPRSRREWTIEGFAAPWRTVS